MRVHGLQTPRTVASIIRATQAQGQIPTPDPSEDLGMRLETYAVKQFPTGL